MPIPGAVSDLTKISTGDVHVATDEGALDAYLARPRHDASRGAVIVIHEAFGPVDHIHDLARRFANVGFDAIAPNLYTRVGTPDPTDMGSVMTKMFGVTDARVVKDLEACAAHLRALDRSSGKVGAIGFCSGGRQTLLFACSSASVNAAIDCWGGFIERASPDADVTPARPTPVMDLVPNLGCPLLVVGGETDGNPSPAVLAELEKRLVQHGKKAKVSIFPGVGHAFLADYRPSYDEVAANTLWPQIVQFFEDHL